MGIFIVADRSLSRCGRADSVYMLVFKYSVAVSISLFVFNEFTADVE